MKALPIPEVVLIAQVIHPQQIKILVGQVRVRLSFIRLQGIQMAQQQWQGAQGQQQQLTIMRVGRLPDSLNRM